MSLTMSLTAPSPITVSVVVPLLDEVDNLRPLYARLVALFEKLGVKRELIFVDDGSTDESFAVIQELAATDPTVIGLSFSRNFGHEPASTAGLDRATGDVAVLMDADLQDPPELIEQMLELWLAGNRIVYATRRHRSGESVFKRFTSWSFYRLLNAFSEVAIPMDTGDFRLVDRRVLEALRACRETDRFVRGLVAWTGFRSTPLLYDRPARHSGGDEVSAAQAPAVEPRCDHRFFDHAAAHRDTYRHGSVRGEPRACAHDHRPASLRHRFELQGYALLASGLFFLGGSQMMLLGVIGEYIGRIYRRNQDRPLYLIDREVGREAHRP